MKTLETSRLRLREWRLADLEDFYQYARDPDTGLHAGWAPHQSREESLKILEMFICNQDCWAIVERNTGKVIGSFGLHKDSHRRNPGSRMIGYVVSHEFKGHGFATEATKAVLKHAFEDLDLDLISVNHFHYNQASRRVIEKCGFQYEGTLRQAIVRFDGAVLDDCCYSMTKQEWFKLTTSEI